MDSIYRSLRGYNAASSRRRGFTVGELAIVVAIIGILAAIAVVAFLGQRRGAQDAAAISTLHNVAVQARAIALDDRSAFSPEMIVALDPVNDYAAGFPDPLIANLYESEKAYNLVAGDRLSKGPNEVSVGMPLEDSEAYSDDVFQSAAYAVLSESGTCWYITDDLRRGIRWAKDTSEDAYLKCYAARLKLAEDRPDFEQEPWDEPTPPAEDAPVWFPDVNGPDHQNPTELDDPDLAGPGGSTTTTTLPSGGGSTTTTAPGGGTTTTTLDGGALSWVSYSFANNHGCAITNTEDLYCWGYNRQGEVGNGTFGNSNRVHVPELVHGDLKWKKVVAGSQHTCGVTTDDDTYCFGYNGYGNLGVGLSAVSLLRSTTPYAQDGPTFVNFAVDAGGADHACGITGVGALYCWGYNQMYQVGDGFRGTLSDTSAPVLIGSDITWAQVSTGGMLTCGVSTSNQGYCWGDNRTGAAGNGLVDPDIVPPDSSAKTPTPVVGGHSWKVIRTAGTATCGITLANEAYCWGEIRYGNLGESVYLSSPTPVQIPGSWIDIAPNSLRLCAIDTNNDAYCWLNNSQGSLGIGSTTSYVTTPSLVSGGHKFQELFASSENVCGVTLQNEFYCWGRDNNGELGNGPSGSYSSIPVRILDPDELDEF